MQVTGVTNKSNLEAFDTKHYSQAMREAGDLQIKY